MASLHPRGRNKTQPLKVAPKAAAEDAVTEVLDLHEDAAELIGQPDPEMRAEMIRTTAYYIAEQRDFEPGHELDDWCEAERAVDEVIARRSKRT
jgi:hypothetical protein